jgi:hypothetical protein
VGAAGCHPTAGAAAACEPAVGRPPAGRVR